MLLCIIGIVVIQVTYAFRSPCADCGDFAIDSTTGVITATKSGYNPEDDGDTLTLHVTATDGAPSAIKPPNPNQGTA